MSDTTPDPVVVGPRALTRLAEPIHAVSYYTREADFSDCGYRGWWHAYFAYRPAPMGAVTAGTVVASFYNFAPRMVARAVPGVWSIRSPADTIALRQDRVARSLARIFADPAPGGDHSGVADSATRAVGLLRRALDATSGAGRPLFAAYADLPWPRDPVLGLWHGCTLLRELRGDSHNIALAAAEIDGVSAHLLMAARGHGTRTVIQRIRGWNDEEWDDALRRLHDRGWLESDGTLTEMGRAGRAEIEAHTDALSGGPTTRLGTDLVDLLDLLRPFSTHLTDTGEVSATWPPKHIQRSTTPERD